MNALASIVAGDGKPPLEWIIAAHEAGMIDPDPFFEPKGQCDD